MMFNLFHALLHRPQRGWDPVSAEHARSYAEEQWALANSKILDRLEEHLGQLHGKRILDLGGGPGQYAIAFAARGAQVTWHDVSRRYLELAREKADQKGVSVVFSLGYLEDAKHLGSACFDLVFCRGCWRYCVDDRKFSRLVYSLIAPGGSGYVDTTVGSISCVSFWQRLQYRLNAGCGYKIGHPNPPPQRLQRYFAEFPVSIVDFGGSLTNDRLLIVKGPGS